MLACATFFVFLVAAIAASDAWRYPSAVVIKLGAVECCDSDSQECCEEQMLKNDTITKCSDDWRRSAACLERFFFDVSYIDKHPDTCCWLHYNRACRALCLINFRKPTLTLEQKLEFLHRCPLADAGDGQLQIPGLHERNEDCQSHQCQLRRHKCFPQCINAVEKNPREFDESICHK